MLLPLDSGLADGWTEEDVARRWSRLFPPKEEKDQGEQGLEVWIAAKAADGEWVIRAGQRLASLS
jgi:hypothetical protein